MKRLGLVSFQIADGLVIGIRAYLNRQKPLRLGGV